MKLIRPADFRPLQKKRRRQQVLKMLTGSVVVGVAGFLVFCLADLSNTHIQTQTAESSEGAPAPQPSKKGVLGAFTGVEFKVLARSIAYPNTQAILQPPDITGDATADGRIRSIAHARGFVLTHIPIMPIQKIPEPRLTPFGDDLLQPLAAAGWADLKAAARRDNIPIALLSAYRSPAYQRQLFLKRLYQRGVTAGRIAAGQADKAVATTLTTTAPPGYSRHHTGYTIDLTCLDGSKTFETSLCFSWLRKGNYKKAKQTGWIPSYPDGVNRQGPEPEAWEYVWVGTSRLTQ
jgi:LAS superfamily LD-carboxypeptidase LdcB